MKDRTDTDTSAETGATVREAFGAATAKPIVTVDVERYQHFLDNSGMTEAQKRDFLEALWSIITAFVDLGFGVHPVQQACGQPEIPLDPNPQADSDRISSENISLKQLFNDAPEPE